MVVNRATNKARAAVSAVLGYNNPGAISAYYQSLAIKKPQDVKRLIDTRKSSGP